MLIRAYNDLNNFKKRQRPSSSDLVNSQIMLQIWYKQLIKIICSLIHWPYLVGLWFLQWSCKVDFHCVFISLRLLCKSVGTEMTLLLYP